MLNLRISLPDTSHAIAALTSALSEADAKVIRLEVFERDDGMATHELCVQESPTSSPQAVQGRVESIPGVIVEGVQPAADTPDAVAPLELAAQLGAAPADSRPARFVDALPSAMWASWALAVQRLDSRCVVLARSERAPAISSFEAPWLPIEGARRLEPAPWMPPAWRLHAGAGHLSLAAAVLDEPDRAVVLARRSSARFRSRELRQLTVLARLAS